MSQLTFDDHIYIHSSARDTERQAAKNALGNSGNQRSRIYEYIASQPDGATLDELASALGLLIQSATPRRKELEDAGLIRDSGKRRKTASGNNSIVWIAK